MWPEKTVNQFEMDHSILNFHTDIIFFSVHFYAKRGMPIKYI